MEEGIQRMSLAVAPEMKDKIVSLRKQDKYCRLTISEIVRQLIQKGLEAEEMQEE